VERKEQPVLALSAARLDLTDYCSTLAKRHDLGCQGKFAESSIRDGEGAMLREGKRFGSPVSVFRAHQHHLGQPWRSSYIVRSTRDTPPPRPDDCLLFQRVPPHLYGVGIRPSRWTTTRRRVPRGLDIAEDVPILQAASRRRVGRHQTPSDGHHGPCMRTKTGARNQTVSCGWLSS
jgi:hypothetical protein